MLNARDKLDSQTFSLINIGKNLGCLGFHLSRLRLGLLLLLSISAQAADTADSVQARKNSELSVSSELQKQLQRENLRQSIDAQFEQLRKDKQSETAFSLELAENYFEYATLLSEAGYYEDANSAYQKALHIQKTNHGIDSEQQLPALEGLFNNNFSVGNIENAEKYIVDIVGIEQKNPSIKDKSSTLMQLKMGHYYLERLKNSSPTSELAPSYLKFANEYFLAVIEQNKDKKLSGSLFPYGELAMTSYLGNQLGRKPEKIYTNDFEPTWQNLLKEVRGHSEVITSSQLAPIEDIQYNEQLDQVLPRALSMLKYYFNKADAEGNVEEALKATLALGDLNYLSDRIQLAKEYYAFAWATSRLLPEGHPDRLALDKPAQLPDFKYAYNSVVNQNAFVDQNSTEMLVMPLQFDVSNRGAIKNIKSLVEADRKLISNAKRELRKHPFRPAIKQGVLTEAQDFVHAIAVNVK